jgi:DNA-binding MarR family transcriptional regulator
MAEDRLAVWETFLMAHGAVLRTLAQELEAETGLPLGWYEVLLHLRRAEGRRLRMQELAANVLLTPSGLTRVVDRMEAEGLVRRDACPGDRRGSYAVLTKDGASRLRRASPIHLRGVEEHFSRHLTDREATVLRTALAKVAGRDGCSAE